MAAVTTVVGVSHLCVLGFTRSNCDDLDIPLDLINLCENFLGYSPLWLLNTESCKKLFHIFHNEASTNVSHQYSNSWMCDNVRIMIKKNDDSCYGKQSYNILRDYILFSNMQSDTITLIDRLDFLTEMNDNLLLFFTHIMTLNALNFKKININYKYNNIININPIKSLTKLSFHNCNLNNFQFNQICNALMNNADNNKTKFELKQLTLSHNPRLFDNRSKNIQSSMDSLCKIMIYFKNSLNYLGLYDTGLNDQQCNQFFQC